MSWWFESRWQVIDSSIDIVLLNASGFFCTFVLLLVSHICPVPPVEMVEEHFIHVTQMACASRQVSPAWRELLCFIFLLSTTTNPAPSSAAPQQQQAPSHPSPDSLFPLCWAQCSFLAPRSLIKTLLAYFSLAETKHGFIWWFAQGREGGW